MSWRAVVERSGNPSVALLTEAELTAWGEQFGRRIAPPFTVALSGDLGAGKTTLARAICAGFGVRDDVTSPTFALVHVYDAPRSAVHHVDLYRLDGPRDLENIGWDDLLRSDGLLIVEWPERAGGDLPLRGVAVELGFVAGDASRRSLRESALGTP